MNESMTDGGDRRPEPRRGLPQGRGGRIQVEPDMRVVGHPEIFAVGDVAAAVDAPCPSWRSRPSRAAGTPPPRSAGCWPASPPSRWSTRTRRPWPRSAATPPWPSCTGGVKLRGRVAWLTWVGLHIVMLVGHRNRLATLANLSVRYLAWPGRLNVIVGDPP